MAMILFIFVIVCVLLRWKRICACIVYMGFVVMDPVINRA